MSSGGTIDLPVHGRGRKFGDPERASGPSPRSAPLRSTRPRPGHIIAALLLVATDAIAVTGAIARFGLVTTNTAILVVLAIWFIAVGDHYRGGGVRIHLSLLDDMVSLAGRVVVAVSLGAAYRELVSGHDVFTVDRLWVLVGSVVFVLIGRTLAYGVLRSIRLLGWIDTRTVLVGSAATTAEVGEAITANPASGLRTIAEFDFPISPAELATLHTEADLVIVEVNDSSDLEVTNLIRQAPRTGAEIYLLPTALARYPGVIPGADQLASMPLIPIRPAANRSLRWRLKRVIDVVLAAVLLLVLSPVMGLVAAVLRLEGGPGVLFRQERVGLGGRRFTMYKLRTIVAESSVADRTWNVEADRIRPFARFCRATSVDELPQLWNVLKGDMSLVGPRPERPHFVKQFSESIPDYENRHRVPVGLTGLAQVHGMRGDTSISLRSRFDNSYIDNWSLFQDVKIMCRTVVSLVSGRGRGS